MNDNKIKQKNGPAGHQAQYDTATGKFISDGKHNKYYENPEEDHKIEKGMLAPRIQQESADSMSNPIGNLGKYGETGGPGRPAGDGGDGSGSDSGRNNFLKKEFGLKGVENRFDPDDDIKDVLTNKKLHLLDDLDGEDIDEDFINDTLWEMFRGANVGEVLKRKGKDIEDVAAWVSRKILKKWEEENEDNEPSLDEVEQDEWDWSRRH